MPLNGPMSFSPPKRVYSKSLSTTGYDQIDGVFAVHCLTPRLRRDGRRGQSIAFVIFAANQDFALAGMIWLADDTFLLHPFHEGSGAIIPDLESTLDIAC